METPRAQVLLYRLQVQEATVGRVAQHLNELRSHLAETQAHRRDATVALKRGEEFLENAAASEISPEQRKQAEFEISRVEGELQNLSAEEQQRQTAEMEAAEQLRTEQAKLSGVEERVDRAGERVGQSALAQVPLPEARGVDAAKR